MKNNKDHELLNLLRKGNENAFRQIYDKYYELLCRFAFHLLQDYSLAEEIVDDVIFYLWEHRVDILITTSLRAYLIRAVRNSCYNVYNKRLRQSECSLNSSDLVENTKFLDFFFIEERHPLGILLERELENELLNKINELPIECRNVFIKSRFEQKKYEDIACELGISINTVKYHIKKALDFLYVQMKQYLYILILAIM